MGRRKKSKMHISGQFSKKPANDMSFEEQEFRTTAEYLEFTLPRQLDAWKFYFTNEERFLAAANDWLEAKCNGSRFPRIEDDVDKGMMKRSTGAYTPSWREDVHLDPEVKHKTQSYGYGGDDDDYWGGWWHGGGACGYGAVSRSWGLPAVPKIKAPEGLSHLDMATVF
jgi:hypothetical protein